MIINPWENVFIQGATNAKGEKEMYTDFAGIEHYESQVTESMVEHDVDGYAKLVGRFVAMNEPDSAEMYAVCTYRAARKLCQLRKKNRQKRTNARMRAQVMRDMGLVKVRGALGGVYWE